MAVVTPTNSVPHGLGQGGASCGAHPLASGGVAFKVWAPFAEKVEVECPFGQRHTLRSQERGYFGAVVPNARVGEQYWFHLDDDLRIPDPASFLQPLGVHGPSEVVDLDFAWTDAGWRGRHLNHWVLYEIHVGTFSPEGTFAGVAAQIPRLVALGVTAIELMPVSQFPGTRNWGYDGVFPSSVQHSYGGPRELQRLVDACHRAGLCVVLDVVYNHLGPEGNWLALSGPYFSKRYTTPWGQALNFDGFGGDEVSRYFLDNALRWVEQFHVDGLRLDAVQEIYDRRARPFLEQLSEAISLSSRKLGRPVYLIAENETNDVRLTHRVDQGGLGIDATWSDDFHHAVHALLTSEVNGYYADYGKIEHLARTWRCGMTYTGQHSAYRGTTHGRPVERAHSWQFVVSVQNHDQVGNRPRGARLSTLVSLERQKLAAGTLLLSPYVPLLFMGEEYGETAQFQYFVEHGDRDLIEAVRQGRQRDSAEFFWTDSPSDPQAEATYRGSVLSTREELSETQCCLAELTRELLRLRQRCRPGEQEWAGQVDEVSSFEAQSAMTAVRGKRWLFAFNFGMEACRLEVALPSGQWELQVASEQSAFRVSPRGSSGDNVQESLPVLDVQFSERVACELPPCSFACYERVCE